MKVNAVTAELKPYPMEQLAAIRRRLEEKRIKVFDFGTGDPLIPTWEPIRQSLINSNVSISQYPSVRGTPELRHSFFEYLRRRFPGIPLEQIESVPAHGSKEAVFHTALSLIGRNGKMRLLYPDPGYPVYRTSALFAGGVPTPVRLVSQNGFLLEPWQLPDQVQSEAAAIWVNYPHNPTGAMAGLDYYLRLIEWAHEKDVIILSDDCYVDIYAPDLDEASIPTTPLALSADRVLSFMSLSKRSGMTGYRSGFIAGDKELILGLVTARANFGVAPAQMIQGASVVAWGDDSHVAERRRIFAERMAVAAEVLRGLGMIDRTPRATFYLWCRIPERFGDDDVGFCLSLAERGVIASPSQWLSEGIKGYCRFAMVPELEETRRAMQIVSEYVGR